MDPNQQIPQEFSEPAQLLINPSQSQNKFALIGKIARIIAIPLFVILGFLFVVVVFIFSLSSMANDTPLQMIRDILNPISGCIFFYGSYVLIHNIRSKFKLLLLLLCCVFIFDSIVIGSRIFFASHPQYIKESINIVLSAIPLLLVFFSYSLEPNSTLPLKNPINQAMQEQVNQLPYQGVSIRATANILDQIIVIIPFFSVVYLLKTGDNLESTLGIAGLIFIIYCTICEGAFGQTLGKKITKIKVVMLDGKPCTWGGSILRNFGRFFDVILGSYILGILFITFTKKRQRIGDIIGRTVVIKL